ncbi:MAG: hypothetical protein AAF664_03770 [Planctomycetota bacterium]
MLTLEATHFSNVGLAVSRSGTLPGGSLRGLPGGIVIDGLPGVGGFSGDLNDALNEYRCGRIQTALQRVRQLESQFGGIASRWEANVGGLLGGARQGNQQLSLQKINELRSAQTKMRMLTGPAIKSFRDLVTALEHEVSRVSDGAQPSNGDQDVQSKDLDPANGAKTELSAEELKNDHTSPGNRGVKPVKPRTQTPLQETPPLEEIGHFASNYRFGRKLGVKRNESGKSYVSPAFQEGGFYFLETAEPSRVIRVRELIASGLVIRDNHLQADRLIDKSELKTLLNGGIWELVGD